MILGFNMALVFILLCLCSNTIQCSHLILPHVFPALGHMNDFTLPYKHLIPSSEKVSILHLPGMRIFRLFKSVKNKYKIVCVARHPRPEGHFKVSPIMFFQGQLQPTPGASWNRVAPFVHIYLCRLGYHASRKPGWQSRKQYLPNFSGEYSRLIFVHLLCVVYFSSAEDTVPEHSEKSKFIGLLKGENATCSQNVHLG